MILEKFGKERMQSIAETITETLKLKSAGLKHVAVTMEAANNDYEYALQNKSTIEELYALRNRKIKWMIELQKKLDLPILTIYLMPADIKDAEQKRIMNEHLAGLLTELRAKKMLEDSQIKITFLGKWYSLGSSLVEQIKMAIDETKEFDKFFLNLCINYDGQEEITDACRLIARKVLAEKLDPETITKETIKENIYSSYFMPPQLIIKNSSHTTTGLLLWDSAQSQILFTDKHWSDFRQQDFLKAVGSY